MTKTSRTMHRILRNIAVGKEPRLIGNRFGYGLTESEVQRRFFEEGFNTSRKTWTNYLTEWQYYGLVTHDEENHVYWFAMNETLKKNAETCARREGVSTKAIAGELLEALA